jgi:hypothetical protein
MRYDYSSFIAADDWLISDCFNLSSSEIYRLGFRYKTEDAFWPENLSVHIGTQPTHIAMNVLLADMPELVNSVYEQTFIDFTVPADGLYYFGFYCYSEALMFNLYLDDITLDIVTHSGKQDIKPLYISLHPNPAHEIITVYLSGSETGVAPYTIVNSEGVTLKNGSLNENENLINISGLPAGMYYLKVTTNNKTTVKKIGKL